MDLNSEHTYIIIGGVTKAGTTSLFRYLSDHPDICGSDLKETCFFLDSDYPRPVKYRYDGSLDRYLNYFNNCSEKPFRLEATPVYAYSPGTPESIKQALKSVKIIFILRGPIDRLVSYYRFEKQGNVLPQDVTFDEYIEQQLITDTTIDMPPHLRALEEGRYSLYLQQWFEVFSREQIFVGDFNSLKNEPQSLLMQICTFIGIDSNFYNHYQFDIHHQTLSVRSQTLHGGYLTIKKKFRRGIYNKPRIRAIFKNMQLLFEPIYHNINKSEVSTISISQETRAKLDEYYQGETETLAKLVGYDQFAWK